MKRRNRKVSMKNYVFIGTDEDLVANSFDVLSDKDIRAIKRTADGNIFISRGDNRLLSFIENLEKHIDITLLREIENE